MNWYKKISQVDPSKYYTSIGHTGKDNIYMWFIDNKFKIHVRKVESKEGHFGHDYWDDFDKYYKRHKMLAQGRYDGNFHVTSLVFVDFMDFISVEEARKMAIFVLNEEFRNPTIREFNR